MQEGGPDSLRKGCWSSSRAVALCEGSLTSMRSRKDRSTEDTLRQKESFSSGPFITMSMSIGCKWRFITKHCSAQLDLRQHSVATYIFLMSQSVNH